MCDFVYNYKITSLQLAFYDEEKSKQNKTKAKIILYRKENITDFKTIRSYRALRIFKSNAKERRQSTAVRLPIALTAPDNHEERCV